MIVAISSTGDSLDSRVDSRFGRCSYFALFDTDTHRIEFISNTAAESSQGAGPSAVQLLAGYGVGKVVSGEFGMKVRPLLESLSVQMQALSNAELSVLEVLKLEKLRSWK